MPNVAKQIYNLKQFKYNYDKYDHFYIGSNNCPLLTFNFKDYKKILKQTKRKTLTFLIPPLPQFFFKTLNSFIDIINESKINNLEIVFNDWGTFNYLKNSNFKLIVGPWFSGQKKDPMYVYLSKQDKTSAMSNYNNSLFLQFLEEHGLNTIELENINQGINFNNLKNFKVNCYSPWVTFSITRHCPFASFEQKTNHRKIITKCKKECLKHKQLEYLDNYYKSVYNGNSQAYYNNKLLPENFNLIVENSLIAEEI